MEVLDPVEPPLARTQDVIWSFLKAKKFYTSRPSGIVVSNADGGAVGPGLVEREERWEASDNSQSVLPLNWGGTELNRTVPCMVLKLTANNRRTSSTLP
ncbi:hypothetical protein TNCV_1684961 [Trichonephila clavipes]|nr:hypothetical protein TNCV_1684961 [Trichonephila clavipes]